jgi:hypothetical protein
MRYEPMPDGADAVDQDCAPTFAEDDLGAWSVRDLAGGEGHDALTLWRTQWASSGS